jgi:hypothetical protein
MENVCFISIARAVMNISLRISLSTVADIPLPNFLIIDEGFGAVDKEHIEPLHQYLKDLATRLDFILMISHVEQLQEVLENPLTITQVNLTSRILNVTEDELVEILATETPAAPKQATLIAKPTVKAELAALAPAAPQNLKLQPDGKLKCELCDKILAVSSKSAHIKSAKHQQLLSDSITKK